MCRRREERSTDSFERGDDELKILIRLRSSRGQELRDLLPCSRFRPRTSNWKCPCSHQVRNSYKSSWVARSALFLYDPYHRLKNYVERTCLSLPRATRCPASGASQRQQHLSSGHATACIIRRTSAGVSAHAVDSRLSGSFRIAHCPQGGAAGRAGRPLPPSCIGHDGLGGNESNNVASTTATFLPGCVVYIPPAGVLHYRSVERYETARGL